MLIAFNISILLLLLLLKVYWAGFMLNSIQYDVIFQGLS